MLLLRKVEPPDLPEVGPCLLMRAGMALRAVRWLSGSLML